jgi:hypothetical protein
MGKVHPARCSLARGRGRLHTVERKIRLRTLVSALLTRWCMGLAINEHNHAPNETHETDIQEQIIQEQLQADLQATLQQQIALTNPPLPQQDQPTEPPDGIATEGAVGIFDAQTTNTSSVYAPFEVADGVFVNGRIGVHWDASSTSTPMPNDAVTEGIRQAQELGAGYAVVLVDVNNYQAQDQLLEALREAGITPVVRLYTPVTPDQWDQNLIDQMSAAAAHLANNVGIELIQVGNEPNIEGAHRVDINDPESRNRYFETSIENQAWAVEAVNDAVAGTNAVIGIPPMAGGATYFNDDTFGVYSAQEYFVALVEEIASREEPGEQLVGWIPTHTYSWPDNESTDPDPNCGCARGHMGYGPEVSEDYEAMAAEILGYDPTALSTEGGPSPDAIRAENPEAAAAAMNEALIQVQLDEGLTQALWLSWETNPGSNAWDNFALYGDDGFYGPGLDLYRDAAP